MGHKRLLPQLQLEVPTGGVSPDTTSLADSAANPETRASASPSSTGRERPNTNFLEVHDGGLEPVADATADAQPPGGNAHNSSSSETKSTNRYDTTTTTNMLQVLSLGNNATVPRLLSDQVLTPRDPTSTAVATPVLTVPETLQHIHDFITCPGFAANLANETASYLIVMRKNIEGMMSANHQATITLALS
ncbi:hypothetical protein EJ08DRAFT_691034 [Tothia fuscella]|uniref:Uncharacterized protein n=1 Tax=Tothia fuscella TaxID=1048955 RepID=A0A9P4P4G2_9PEZI|nr:hypothetical protein EJ08DRAFT_691034 [Tothia fuscella]